VITVYTVVVIGLFLVLDYPINALEPASALFYFANYVYSTPHFNDQMPFGIFWSLSVEEHFYLLLPSLFFFLSGRTRLLAAIVAAACLACLVARLIVLHFHPELTDSYVLYFRTQYRLDSIGFGVLLAIFCENEEWRWMVRACARPLVVAIAGAALFASLAIRDPWFREGIRYSLQSVAVAVLIAAILFGERYRLAQRLLNWRVADWVGRLSYSLYVWHMLMIFLVVKLLSPQLGAAASAVVALTASFVVAAISFYVVESPLRTIPHRFRRGRAAQGRGVSIDETMTGRGSRPGVPLARAPRPVAARSPRSP
jgi:peptidoglycan/LPS O-acetylase OafA/YrhL